MQMQRYSLPATSTSNSQYQQPLLAVSSRSEGASCTSATVFNLPQNIRARAARPTTSRRWPSKNSAIVDMRRRLRSSGEVSAWWRRAKSHTMAHLAGGRVDRLASAGKLDADALCRWSKYQFQQCTAAGTVHYWMFSSTTTYRHRLPSDRPTRGGGSSGGERASVSRARLHRSGVRCNGNWFHGEITSAVGRARHGASTDRDCPRTKLAFDDDFMDAECVDDGLLRQAPAASVAVLLRRRHRRICNRWRWQVMCFLRRRKKFSELHSL